MCEVHIGGQEHEFLAIRVLGSQSTDSPVPDYWENNWLICRVEVCSVQSLHGAIRTWLGGLAPVIYTQLRNIL
jgi:hypothetical protein